MGAHRGTRLTGRRRAAILLGLAIVGVVLVPLGARDAPTPASGPGAFGSRRSVLAVPAPAWLNDDDGDPVGARAVLLSFATTGESLGRWWVTVWLPGTDRVEVVDRNPPSWPPRPDRLRSDRLAWQVAHDLLDDATAPEPCGDPAAWNSGEIHGPSAELVVVLALLDRSLPGALAGDLDVAGTGDVDALGGVHGVSGIDAKYLAARLAGADVFFAPRNPVVDGRPEDDPVRPRTWWRLDAERRVVFHAWSGLLDRDRQGPRVVVVRDVREALAYLCGRVGGPACDAWHDRPVGDLGPRLVSGPRPTIVPRSVFEEEHGTPPGW